MTFTEDNRIFVWDWQSYDLLVYNEMNQYITSLHVSVWPIDITVIPHKPWILVVTFGNTNIQFIDLKKIVWCKTEYNYYLHCNITTADKILVNRKGNINILNIEITQQKDKNVKSDRINHIHFLENYYYCTYTSVRYCVKENKSRVFSLSIKDEQFQRLHADGTPDRVIITNDRGINNCLTLCVNKTND